MVNKSFEEEACALLFQQPINSKIGDWSREIKVIASLLKKLNNQKKGEAMEKIFMVYTEGGKLLVRWDGLYFLGGALVVVGTMIVVLGIYFLAMRTTGI